MSVKCLENAEFLLVDVFAMQLQKIDWYRVYNFLGFQSHRLHSTLC